MVRITNSLEPSAKRITEILGWSVVWNPRYFFTRPLSCNSPRVVPTKKGSNFLVAKFPFLRTIITLTDFLASAILSLTEPHVTLVRIKAVSPPQLAIDQDPNRHLKLRKRARVNLLASIIIVLIKVLAAWFTPLVKIQFRKVADFLVVVLFLIWDLLIVDLEELDNLCLSFNGDSSSQQPDTTRALKERQRGELIKFVDIHVIEFLSRYCHLDKTFTVIVFVVAKSFCQLDAFLEGRN